MAMNRERFQSTSKDIQRPIYPQDKIITILEDKTWEGLTKEYIAFAKEETRNGKGFEFTAILALCIGFGPFEWEKFFAKMRSIFAKKIGYLILTYPREGAEKEVMAEWNAEFAKRKEEDEILAQIDPNLIQDSKEWRLKNPDWQECSTLYKNFLASESEEKKHNNAIDKYVDKFAREHRNIPKEFVRPRVLNENTDVITWHSKKNDPSGVVKVSILCYDHSYPESMYQATQIVERVDSNRLKKTVVKPKFLYKQVYANEYYAQVNADNNGRIDQSAAALCKSKDMQPNLTKPPANNDFRTNLEDDRKVLSGEMMSPEETTRLPDQQDRRIGLAAAILIEATKQTQTEQGPQRPEVLPGIADALLAALDKPRRGSPSQSPVSASPPKSNRPQGGTYRQLLGFMPPQADTMQQAQAPASPKIVSQATVPFSQTLMAALPRPQSPQIEEKKSQRPSPENTEAQELKEETNNRPIRVCG